MYCRFRPHSHMCRFLRDANSVYGSGVPTEEHPPGLIHIEFNPIRISVIQGTAELGIFSIASPLSREPIVVSGKYEGACGLFVIDRLGQVRMAAQNSSCDYVGSWVRISLSPDGNRVVGYRKPRLEIIDLINGAVRSLGDDFIAAAWSPDGKWLAAVQGGRSESNDSDVCG